MASYSETMKPRLDYAWASPGAVEAMAGLEQYLKSTSLDPKLRELIKLRASQINGCGYCTDLHWREASAHGDTPRRLNALCTWRESTLFTPKERAALDWTEALTRLDCSPDHVPDELFARVSEHFEGRELVDLTLAVVTINGWNRIAVAFRTQPPA